MLLSVDLAVVGWTKIPKSVRQVQLRSAEVSHNTSCLAIVALTLYTLLHIALVYQVRNDSDNHSVERFSHNFTTQNLDTSYTRHIVLLWIAEKRSFTDCIGVLQPTYM